MYTCILLLKIVLYTEWHLRIYIYIYIYIGLSHKLFLFNEKKKEDLIFIAKSLLSNDLILKNIITADKRMNLLRQYSTQKVENCQRWISVAYPKGRA